MIMSQGLIKAKINLLEGIAKSLPRIVLTSITVPYASVRAFMIPQLTTHIGYHIDFNFLEKSKLIGAWEHGLNMFDEAVDKYRKNKQEIQQHK